VTAVARLRRARPAVIAVGASAGALDALRDLLPPLPPDFPAPIVVVVHVPPARESGLPAVLARECRLEVVEAEDKMALAAGKVAFAPPDYHLLIEAHGGLALSADPPVQYSRPSIDVLFESAASAFGPRALGILLSGANADGAQGLAAIARAGGLTWVQAPETAQVSTMPEAALASWAHETMDPGSMGAVLAAWAGDQRSKGPRDQGAKGPRDQGTKGPRGQATR
jgi:two-component system chemotaxis response regulator CheB